MFERLTPWLDAHMGRFGFYRPYASTLCGAGIEPWHLSYWPVADEALEGLTLPVLRRALDGSAIEGKAQLLERLPEVYTRFILAVDHHAPGASRASRPTRLTNHAGNSRFSRHASRYSRGQTMCRSPRAARPRIARAAAVASLPDADMTRRAMARSSAGARIVSSRCVLKKPGMATDTWMPVPASSAAAVSLSEITAALVAL